MVDENYDILDDLFDAGGNRLYRSTLEDKLEDNLMETQSNTPEKAPADAERVLTEKMEEQRITIAQLMSVNLRLQREQSALKQQITKQSQKIFLLQMKCRKLDRI